MEDREVVDSGAMKDIMEAGVVAQATQDSRREDEQQENAVKQLEEKTSAQAMDPTAAPLKSADNKKQGSSEGSSSDEDGDSSSLRRERSPSRRRAPSPSRSPPLGDFQRAYKPKRRGAARFPSQASERAEGLSYKVKFAQVIDDMRFDVEDVLMRAPRSWLATPTVLTFQMRAPEAKIVSRLDEIFPTIFRAYYKEGVFSVRAPRSCRAAQKDRSRRRGRNRTLAAPAGHSASCSASSAADSAAWARAASIEAQPPRVSQRGSGVGV